MTENETQARVNVTYAGSNGDLPDPVDYEATDGDIRAMVSEAIRSGSIPGIPHRQDATLEDFVVDRFRPNEQRPYPAIFVRPKTPFGA